jgi:hypothetical protein
MTETFKDFVEGVSTNTETAFKRRGRIIPIWSAITRDGSPLITPAPCDDKDMAAAMMRALFELADVVRYCFIDEAWQVRIQGQSLAGESVEDWKRRMAIGPPPSQHPDRIEIIMLSAEDEREGALMGRREIIRPARGRPKLGPLNIYAPTQGEGRFTGLLPRKGKMQ